MSSVILHSDFNNFYASVEMLYDPALRGRPVAVAGDEEARHGIVLAKNDIAKGFGIHTGQVLWEARQRCPELVCVPAHYDRYLRFSGLAREIYVSYTDQVEAFGLDECWLDVTGSTHIFGSGPTIADDLRGRIRRELGLTVSVGVSYNKVFAKLGSDMKKPDATTVITPENFRETAWRLPVSDLLYVGPATTRKLGRFGIDTIGTLAQADVKLVLLSLAESVGTRLREQGCTCTTVSAGIRDNRLAHYDRQVKLARSTNSTLDIWEAACGLFHEHHTSGTPIRSLAVKASGLAPVEELAQLSLFPEEQKAQRRSAIDQVVDQIRGKYGYYSIRRAITLLEPALDLNAKGEHVIHPIGFLGTLSK